MTFLQKNGKDCRDAPLIKIENADLYNDFNVKSVTRVKLCLKSDFTIIKSIDNHQRLYLIT